MRYTFEQVQQYAARRGVLVERSGRSRCKYEVRRMNDDSMVEECQTLTEVIDAIPEFAHVQKHLDTVQ